MKKSILFMILLLALVAFSTPQMEEEQTASAVTDCGVCGDWYITDPTNPNSTVSRNCMRYDMPPAFFSQSKACMYCPDPPMLCP